MRRNNFLPGIILISTGLYFLLKQFDITLPYANVIFTWPSILVFIGLVMAFQGFSNRDDSKMFTGATLLGLGVLFHGVHTYGTWGYHWGYFTLIVAIAFLMKYFVNKRDGLTPAMILFAITAFALFSSEVSEWIRTFAGGFESLWPVLLIAIGVYLLFFRKK
ncbi:DUF5668 domain-containing protein [Bacillus shivajii]|uniref:LiaF transmembrane domain-containing protein n=1 Tax=Bacillus shivajii TaxID=1983719 RepID=UPI001CFAF05B|nr:DUF5668 domain-containing protein [Bacillus shivajii]UCZ52131.1 DUF5668 domain-containing protein [Bacillus shivajii]